MIAIFLTAIAVIAILPMQDMSLRTGARSDYLGRAAGIMQTELETQEYSIMNVSNAVNEGVVTKSVTVSGLTGAAGDITFMVNTSIAVNPVAVSNSWIINVRVTWPNGPVNGISSSIVASRQMNF
jgi:Tfp pilus assembly protein PilV